MALMALAPGAGSPGCPGRRRGGETCRKWEIVVQIARDTTMIRTGSPVVRVSAPTPGAVTAPRGCTGRRRRIVAPIPARARYLFSVAVDVIPTFPGGISGEHAATTKQSDRAESAHNREQYHGSSAKVLTHMSISGDVESRAPTFGQLDCRFIDNSGLIFD
jgi:hypothetical protein